MAGWTRKIDDFLYQHRSSFGFLGLFYLLSSAYWWPLPLHLRTSQLEWPVIDPTFGQWIIGWGVRSLTHYPWRFFEAPMFYPWHHVLAWGDNMFAITIFAIPLVPLFGLLATYNLLLISTSAVAAFSLFLLCKHLFKDWRPALLAAVFWGFSYSRYLEYGHIEIVATSWIPLTFLFAELMRERYRRSYLVGFIAVTWLTLATNIYLAFFILISFAIYFTIVLAYRKFNLVTTKRLLIGLGLALVAAIPVYLPSFILNLRHPTVHLDQFPARLDQFLPLPPTGQLVRKLIHLPAAPANPFALGLTTTVLLLIGLAALWQKRRRPFYVAMAAIGLFAFLAAFGPTITWHNQILIAKNPFFYLPFKLLPGFKVLRTPTRWNYIFDLAVAVMAGLGFNWIKDLLKLRRSATILAVILTSLIFMENLPAPISIHATYNISDYPVYAWLAKQPADQPILELPNFPIAWRTDTGHIEARRIFLSTYHWHPRVGGAITPFVPVGYTSDQYAIANIGVDPKAMELLRSWRVQYVIFFYHDYEGPSWNGVTAEQVKRRLDTTPGLIKFKIFPEATVYRVAS